MSELTDIRCPSSFGRLFVRLRISGKDVQVTDDNWMQFSCSDCRREYRRQDPRVHAVRHYYAFDGSFMRTELVMVGDASQSWVDR